MRRAIPLLLALLLFGCPSQPPPTPPTPPRPSSTTEPPPAPGRSSSGPALPPGFISSVAHPGLGYLAVDGTGLVRLRDGVFSVVDGIRPPIRTMVFCKDGLWVTNYSGLYLVQDEKPPQKLGSYDQPGSIDDLAVAGDGTVWTVGYEGVGRYDGKGWTMIDKSKLGGASLLRGIAVDGSGRAWVSTSRELFRREGPTFKRVDTTGAGVDKPFFDRLSGAPDGAIYASFAQGLLRCDEAGCSPFAGTRERPNAFAVAPDLRVLLVTRLTRVSLISIGGEEAVIDPDTAGFRAGAIRGVTADQAGRFWLSSDLGPIILDTELKAVQWEPGRVPELSGQIQVIALAGHGPNLPAVGSKAKGTIAGRVLRREVPVEGATVELCESPSITSQGSPCREAAFSQTATTDEHGQFRLIDVPAGPYRFAIRGGARWIVTVVGDCCSRLVDGQTLEIGSIGLPDR